MSVHRFEVVNVEDRLGAERGSRSGFGLLGSGLDGSGSLRGRKWSGRRMPSRISWSAGRSLGGGKEGLLRGIQNSNSGELDSVFLTLVLGESM